MNHEVLYSNTKMINYTGIMPAEVSAGNCCESCAEECLIET
jgi:hypothetical protein